jgi:dihydrofolate reductase
VPQQHLLRRSPDAENVHAVIENWALPDNCREQGLSPFRGALIKHEVDYPEKAGDQLQLYGKGRLTMAKLIYIAITSLDGYVEDEGGTFDWAVPDEEVHTFVNDLLRPVDTYLYGRRMYETMVGWETMDTAAQAPFTRDFAEIWRAADKIVYSKTLEKVSSARTRIERHFDPEAVRRTKMLAGRDITVAGASLAAHAIKAGLVDEYHLIISPILVGGGKQSLPNHVLLRLDLLAERRFGNGVVHLHYRPKRVS